MANINAKWVNKLEMKLFNFLIPRIEKLIRKYDKTVVYDSSQFQWVPLLENHWETIRDEFLNYYQQRYNIPNFQDISKIQYDITKDDKWKMLVLFGFGKEIEENTKHFPETMKLLDQVPGIESAMFSIFHPHKHVPEHHGNIKMILRYQLGLIIPEPREKCRININGTNYYWEEGKSLLFDNTINHEVWNETNQMRVVLMLNVFRNLPFPLHLLNRLGYRLIIRSKKIQDALANLDEIYNHY